MKTTRLVVAAIAIAFTAACSSSPTAPDTTKAEMGKMGGGQVVAPAGAASFGKMGGGQ